MQETEKETKIRKKLTKLKNKIIKKAKEFSQEILKVKERSDRPLEFKDLLNKLEKREEQVKNIVELVEKNYPNFEKDITHFYSVEIKGEKIDFNFINLFIR